jgi:phage host-nuclease inhibitor protein Gam
MTPARRESCLRLLKGIAVLADRNRLELEKLVRSREEMNENLLRLAQFVGEARYADARLLLSMSRRIGRLSSELEKCEQQLAVAYNKNVKLSRSMDILTKRIQEYELERQDNELSELTSDLAARKLTIQSATRN